MIDSIGSSSKNETARLHKSRLDFGNLLLANFSEVVKKGSHDDRLLASIDWDRLPRHVAIIMDGNGRWAAQRGQPRIAGHRAGVAAVRKLQKEGKPADELSEARLAAELYTQGLPELDLLVRTSGELRISNFLLWQNAYAEIYVTETLWPDFRRVHLLEAVIDYQQRSRRFGGLKLVVNAK